MIDESSFYCEEGNFHILSLSTGNVNAHGEVLWEAKIWFPPFSPLFAEMLVDSSCLTGRVFSVNMFDGSKQFMLVSYVKTVSCDHTNGECTATVYTKFLDNLQYLEHKLQQKEK